MSVDQLGRAYAAYRRSAGSRSMVALLVANAIPLVGVLFFGWSLITILVIYWLENGIVGFWNVPKILLAQGSLIPTLPPMPDAAARAATGSPEAAERLQAEWRRTVEARMAAASSATTGVPGFVSGLGSGLSPVLGRAGVALFFVFHYGIFWFVHGVFVFALPQFMGGTSTLAGCGDTDPFGGVQGCEGPFGPLLWSNVAIAGVALFLSHGASLVLNYIGRGEYLTASPTGQMGAVYGRVIVLHLTILFGAFAVAFLGSPVGALLLLVGLKTFLDLGLHRRERHAADARVRHDTSVGQVVRAG